jgi:prevent-host-death family protein
MKAINVTEFKAHLSKYLRMASRGSRIIVHDRNEPVAQLGPVSKEALPWRERLAQEGRLRLGTQAWAKLKIARTNGSIDIQSSLRAVREDPNEIRRH